MNEIPDWLLQKTFVIQHNPNCPSAFCIRLVGAGCVDYKPASETKDILGYGKTIIEAAENAKAEMALSDLNRPQRGIFPREFYKLF